MAVDTSTKRFSMLGVFNPSLKHVIPGGSVSAGQRSTFLDLYSGIALSDVASVWTEQSNAVTSWSSQADVSTTWTEQTDSTTTWTVQ